MIALFLRHGILTAQLRGSIDEAKEFIANQAKYGRVESVGVYDTQTKELFLDNETLPHPERKELVQARVDMVKNLGLNISAVKFYGEIRFKER